MALKITLTHDPTDFENLRDEWTTLQSRAASDSVFTTWQWLWLWWQEVDSQDGKLWLMIARDVGDGALKGVAPLVLLPKNARGFTWRQLEFISNRAHMDHWDFVIEPGLEAEMIPLFMDEIEKRTDEWDTLKLKNMLPHSSSLHYLRAYTDEWEESNGHIAPYLALPGDFDTLMTSLNKRKRKNLRRYTRAVEDAYGDNWSFEVVESDREKIKQHMNVLIDFHQSQWEEQGEAGAFGDPQMTRVYDRMIEVFAEQGWLRLYVVRLGDDIAAVTLNFHYRGRAYDFVGGTNTELAEFSPGHLITMNIMRYNIEQGITEHDFMWGDEEYKFRWNAVPRVDRVLTWRSSTHVKVAKHVMGIARTGKQVVNDLLKPKDKPTKADE